MTVAEVTQWVAKSVVASTGLLGMLAQGTQPPCYDEAQTAHGEAHLGRN